nr:S8 family serine peptidase [Bradyrhizobium guangzhouense]
MAPLVRYGEAVLLDHIGVAVIRGDTGDHHHQLNLLSNKSEVLHVYPEFYVFAHASDGNSVHASEDDSGTHEDSLSCAWGIEATGACRSKYSGAGIKVAVLDTGFDRRHPDYAGRQIKYWSAFGCDGRDVRGHGTHCAGTAAGPRAVHNRMRYGVAPDAELHVYKVLNDGGTGSEGELLLGINQAMVDGCDIISMSCGRSASGAKMSNPIFDAVGQTALEEGRLMVAAAGNSSSRDIGYIAPIDFPANSPTIMSVAAVDSRLGLTNFSSGIPVGTAGIDIAAPGAGVFSSVPMPRKYQRLRGTSMAAPHVAGIAALWAESDASLRATKLWQVLISNAKPLLLDKRDVGAGLVQAPR